MADLTAVAGAGLAAGAAAAAKVRKGLDRTTQALAVAAGTVAASLSELNNFGVDPQLISRITSAASNHGVAGAVKLHGDLIAMFNADPEVRVLATDLDLPFVD